MKKKIINIVCGIALFTCGYSIASIYYKKHTKFAGILRIDNSEEELPERLFLELEQDLKTIEKQKIIKLKVVKKNYL